MRTLVLLIVFFSVAIVFSACKKQNNEIVDLKLTTQQKNMVVSGNHFAFNMLREVSESETAPKNIMISPLSINFALAMTANGAKNNTLSQMLTTMDFEGYEMEDFNEYFRYLKSELVALDPRVELSIANSIWYRNNFTVLQSFLDVNQNYYDAEVASLDFSSGDALNTINDWVNDETHGKIERILEEIGPDMVMFLINAVYFYGEWKYEFEESATYDQPFYLQGGGQIDVSMMHQEAEMKYYFSDEVAIAELPYGQGNFVMDVILPPIEQTAAELVSTLDSEKWTQWQNGLYTAKVSLGMPRFEFSYEKTLNDMLIALGMNDLFDSGLADLSGINGTGGLFVSEVKHKTFISVDEKGTEAAAVTSVGVELTSVDPGVVYLTLDRPFVFIIREVTTGAILFSGIVSNPVAE
ncbi:MAG: serpin family protein [Bacteroidales bacterium]|nr:serpin family protein [Bacteroidales bacterium]HOY37975.1 serpin family protein [Bacteroidales bacterium]HQP03168.1 serpin family protein [Bacteroidales bacterium]